MSKQSKVWDRFARGYAKKPVADAGVYQQKLQITRTYFRADMEVLEFGCGTGSTAIAHAPFVAHISAIDFSAKMLDIARRKAQAESIENVTFRQASIDQFDVPDATYDVVMGHSILHLLEEKEAVIARVFTMLKPGGVFVSSTVCMGGKARLMQVILPVGYFFGVLPLVRFFSVDALVVAITSAGFDIDHQWLPDGSDAVFIVAKKPL